MLTEDKLPRDEEPQHQEKVAVSPKGRLLRFLRGGSSTLTVAILLFIGFWGGHWLSPTHMSDDAGDEGTSASAIIDEVTLTPEKMAAAGIETARAAIRELRPVDTVPGRLGYNELRHADINVPVESVVQELLVRPGQAVEPGDPLVVLSSGEVALARNELLQAAAQVRLAQTRYSWQQEIHRNLLDLVAALRRGDAMESIEEEFARRTLGEQRQVLLSAYSELRLAEQVVEQSRQLERDGVLSGRVFQERMSRRERAAANFKAVLDQVQYDVRQQLAVVEAELQVARRRQAAAEEKLKLLVGPFGNHQSHDGEPLAHYRIHAPFAGKVGELRCTPALRVARGDRLMVVGDHRRLWLSVRIHQRQWSAVELREGQAIRFRLPAYPRRQWEAQVSFVGTELVKNGHYLPLVATVDNTEGRFRPGMFAWVDVPMQAGQRLLAIPESAVQRLEGATFVFVRTGPRTFRRQRVSLGVSAGEWIAVASGLREGDEVVSAGAFYLKSESLLEGEVE